jgi:proprotein convertase subtilisin/kexin type 5
VAAACPLGCLECLSSSICSKCLSGYFLFIDKLCYSSCPARYYQNNGTLSCLACSFGCFACINDQVCLSCSAADFRYFHNETQRCVPLDGYFENLTQICPPCPQGCSVCKSSILCSGCLSGFFIGVDNLCHSTCGDRYYTNWDLLTSGPSLTPLEGAFLCQNTSKT